MKILSHGTFLKINGINHRRFVGIVKDGDFAGQAFDFYEYNVEGYRPAQTEVEKQACLLRAENYYNECVGMVKIGKFSTSYEEITEKCAETPEDEDEILADLEKWDD